MKGWKEEQVTLYLERRLGHLHVRPDARASSTYCCSAAWRRLSSSHGGRQVRGSRFRQMLRLLVRMGYGRRGRARGASSRRRKFWNCGYHRPEQDGGQDTKELV